jgi:hypothetical protein
MTIIKVLTSKTIDKVKVDKAFGDQGFSFGRLLNMLYVGTFFSAFRSSFGIISIRKSKISVL